ncbi:MAG TPA: ATP-binding protein [Thermoanaerobaculia bacterium]|nr:ATP-binding protein [Thermoanaerobaculia bacterium]
MIWRKSPDAAAAEERIARLEAELDALRRQRAIDLQILDGLAEGLLAVDRERRVVLVNRAFAELFDAADAAGKPLHDVVRVAAVFEAFDRALAGEESVERFTTRNVTLEMRTLPLGGEAIAAVAIFIDVTHLERLESIRRNFISDFSHEVRTPLAGLRSAVETHDDIDHLTEAEGKQLRRIMSRQLRRLERLVDELSELHRIESGDLQLSRQRIDLRALVDELVEDFAGRAQFVVRGEHAFAEGDPLRLQQALGNIIDNAIKYGAGPIEIDAAPGEVRIRDHGEGIADHEKERIFRRFYRIDKSRSTDTGGTGLGLAIAKHIVLQHGGTIEVESEPGEGATFIVRLP